MRNDVKVGMFLLVVIAGILGIEPILNLLGEGGGDSGSIAGIILLYLMWLIVALMAKWDSIFKKNNNNNYHAVILCFIKFSF